MYSLLSDVPFFFLFSNFGDNFFSRLRFSFFVSFFFFPGTSIPPYDYRISDGIKFDTYNGLASSKSRA